MIILTQLLNNNAIVSSLDKSQATVEFGIDGTILRANANFCNALGYEPSEIVGKHHRIFVSQIDLALNAGVEAARAS